jgi:hypothetical protein
MSDDLTTPSGQACLGGQSSSGTLRNSGVTELPMRRRRFLMTMGAAGLVVAETLFGRTAFARAVDGCACCWLESCPPNITYQFCTQHCNYIWTCVTSSGLQCCNCCEIVNCETKIPVGNSAYDCF